jgi:hypothetical protein
MRQILNIKGPVYNQNAVEAKTSKKSLLFAKAKEVGSSTIRSKKDSKQMKGYLLG